MLRKIAPALIALTLVAGCTTDGFGPKQGFGTLGGAAAGGLLGSQIGGGTGKLVAVGAGTILGAFLGSEIGSSLDRADQAYAGRAIQQSYAAPIGQKIVWDNPESGNSGVIVHSVRAIRQTQTLIAGNTSKRLLSGAEPNRLLAKLASSLTVPGRSCSKRRRSTGKSGISRRPPPVRLAGFAVVPDLF